MLPRSCILNTVNAVFTYGKLLCFHYVGTAPPLQSKVGVACMQTPGVNIATVVAVCTYIFSVQCCCTRQELGLKIPCRKASWWIRRALLYIAVPTHCRNVWSLHLVLQVHLAPLVGLHSESRNASSSLLIQLLLNRQSSCSNVIAIIEYTVFVAPMVLYVGAQLTAQNIGASPVEVPDTNLGWLAMSSLSNNPADIWLSNNTRCTYAAMSIHRDYESH